MARQRKVNGPPSELQTWFGVRCLFRTFVSGTPNRIDAALEESSTLVEERIILCLAASAEEAIAKAEQLTVNPRPPYTNGYGQTVTSQRLEACDAYRIDGDPCDGQEVYSVTRIVDGRVSNDEVIELILGPAVTEPDRARRMVFLRGEIADALGKGSQ